MVGLDISRTESLVSAVRKLISSMNHRDVSLEGGGVWRCFRTVSSGGFWW